MAAPSDSDSPPQVLERSKARNPPSGSLVQSPSELAGIIDGSSFKISVNWDDQELNILTAFAKNPKRVREELLEAIRHVELEESDINLLLMERIFKSALKKPSSVTAEHMMGALESFRCDDPNSISFLFYEHGRTYGIVIYILTTSADSGLLARLEQLPHQDQILLVRRLTEEPPRDLSKFLTNCAMPKRVKIREPLANQRLDSQDGLCLHKGADLPSLPESPKTYAPILDDFNYFRLPEWADFRLVMLERECETAEIRCHLIPASFKENFHYEALSYTWGGNSGGFRSILVNGKRFSVMSNLFSALQRLRNGGSGNYRCLWIDSLCIDQTNGKERNHQVAIMGRIYQNAQTVLVWLGEHSSDSEKAIDFITDVFELSRYRKYGLGSSYTYDGDEKYEVSEWQAVDALFRRDYWERTWIIQEIQLARNVLVYCGDRTFDWTAGSAFFDFLQGDRDRHLETDPESVVTKQSVMQSPAIQLLESALVFQRRDMTLKQLLYRHENSLCRESRDKIYGLLALASDCKERRFEPNYKKDLSGVYRDALGLEMTTSFSGQHISPDMVHYSYFLQKILNLFLPGPESLTVSVARDPVCILGYSCGRLREVDVEYQDTSGPISRVFRMSDSEFLVHKGPEPPRNSAFGYMLDPTKAPIGYTWLEPSGLRHKSGYSRKRSFDRKPLKRSSSPGLNNHPSLLQQIAIVPSEPPVMKTFVLPKGQTVLVPEVAQAGDEICMFSKHDLAILLREDEPGKWEVMGNALVLTTEEKRSRRPREELRSFQYCLPDYDIFPPPTSDPQNSFYIRMSTMTLQWMTRIRTS